MNIKEKLKLLKEYLENHRQVGHTTAALDGVRNTEGAIILACDHDNRRTLRYRSKPELDTKQVRVLGNDLKYINSPIVLDNRTVAMLCSEALAEIERLEVEPGKRAPAKNRFDLTPQASPSCGCNRCLSLFPEREGDTSFDYYKCQCPGSCPGLATSRDEALELLRAKD